jgi:pimeloyl-ACP methyl ester carboxylesterase
MFWFMAADTVAGATNPSHALLRAEGHDVYAPSLTGLGEREHLFRCGVDLDCHIKYIVKLLHFEDLHRVILVGHSYGGMVITGAADRANDRVGHLVYLDAYGTMSWAARARIIELVTLFHFANAHHFVVARW